MNEIATFRQQMWSLDVSIFPIQNITSRQIYAQLCPGGFWCIVSATFSPLYFNNQILRRHANHFLVQKWTEQLLFVHIKGWHSYNLRHNAWDTKLNYPLQKDIGRVAPINVCNFIDQIKKYIICSLLIILSYLVTILNSLFRKTFIALFFVLFAFLYREPFQVMMVLGRQGPSPLNTWAFLPTRERGRGQGLLLL